MRRNTALHRAILGLRALRSTQAAGHQRGVSRENHQRPCCHGIMRIKRGQSLASEPRVSVTFSMQVCKKG